MIKILFCNRKTQFWSLRLSVRTRGFHPRKRGSIPLGTAISMYHYVYILKTLKGYKDKTYVGYSTNVLSRLDKHNTSKGAKSTRGYQWQVIYKKRFKSKAKAMSFEYLLKKDRKKRLSILKELI